MRSNTQFTVSLQTMVIIAIIDGRRITSDNIAASTGCNPVMVRQLFGKLKAAGLLDVTPGRGSTTLARSADQITVWDIYAAVDSGDGEDMFAFHPNISQMCPVGRCFEDVVGNHLEDAFSAMRESLEQVTLAQLVEEVYEASPASRVLWDVDAIAAIYAQERAGDADASAEEKQLEQM